MPRPIPAANTPAAHTLAASTLAASTFVASNPAASTFVASNPTASPDTLPPPADDPQAIFALDGPINPAFVNEAVRVLMRALPLDPAEPQAWAHRRMHAGLLALAALHPRDEIELMLGVQAVAAWHAAAAGWRLGMNHHRPCGDSTRHTAAAATAARSFDSLLRALERRQAKPLTVPPGRPPGRAWPPADASAVMQAWEARIRQGTTTQGTTTQGTTTQAADAQATTHAADPHPSAAHAADPAPAVVWSPRAIALANELREADRIAVENEGLDIEHTDGILPGGGMIMPEHPTPQQEAYMARRLGLAYRRECQENLRRGLRQYPPIRHIRPGDLIL
ncbi:hypothetical protein [Rhodopila sp.]|uniref:hypothetical protein n=1 Tax=Rhodopila sp. TaxID=2480087 RepID=UPI003D0B5CE9